jgi:hypothetical protein
LLLYGNGAVLANTGDFRNNPVLVVEYPDSIQSVIHRDNISLFHKKHGKVGIFRPNTLLRAVGGLIYQIRPTSRLTVKASIQTSACKGACSGM